MAILKQGCCCSVRACVHVLGWVSIVLSLASVGGCYLVYSATSASTCDGEVAQLSAFCNEAAAEFLVSGVFSGAWLLSSILLLLGIYKENRFLLVPFLVCYPAELVVSITCSILLSITLLGLNDNNGVAGVVVGTICFSGARLSITIYSVLCVISHYQNLRDHPSDNTFRPHLLETYPSPMSNQLHQHPPQSYEEQEVVSEPPAHHWQCSPPPAYKTHDKITT